MSPRLIPPHSVGKPYTHSPPSSIVTFQSEACCSEEKPPLASALHISHTNFIELLVGRYFKFIILFYCAETFFAVGVSTAGDDEDDVLLCGSINTDTLYSKIVCSVFNNFS